MTEVTDTPPNPREVPPVPDLFAPHRFGCRPLSGPPQVFNSAVHSAVADSVLCRDNAPRRSVWCLRHRPGVLPLLLKRNPCAVVGVVPIVVIKALNRQRFDVPTCGGPRRKRLKAILPFGADRDAARSVAFKRLHVRVSAPALHVRPAAVKMRSGQAVRAVVSDLSAAACSAVSSAELVPVRNARFPAIANTVPKGTCPSKVYGSPSHREASVAASGQVNQWGSHAAA